MPVYDVSTLGTTANQITFNDDTASPYYRMVRRTPTRREVSEFDIKLPEGTGDADYQTFIGKSYLIIEGTMYPNDEREFDTGKQSLRKLASLDVEQADANSDQGYVPYKWSENDGYNKQLMVKVLYVDLPESSRNGLKQPFRLLCKIKYPVITAQTVSTSNIGNATATLSGTPLSWVLPKVVGATTYSSTGSIVNAGDLPTYPSFVIYGPVNRPKITNTTTGEYIEIAENLLTSSDSMIINYDQDSLSLTVAGNSVLGSLTSGSTLFKIRSGTNNFTFTGSTVGAGAYATVSAYSAWPLS